MSCRKATELISVSLDRPLTRGERLALRVHLACCTPCRRFKRQIAAVRAVLRRAADHLESSAGPGSGHEPAPAPMPAEARERVRRALAEVG